MIRFDEVPIRRLFEYREDKHDAEILQKTEAFKMDDGDDVNCMNGGGDFFYIGLDEMVELVDKCANCKHLSKESVPHCKKHKQTISKKWGERIKQDPETFWCSEGELKGD